MIYHALKLSDSRRILSVAVGSIFAIAFVIRERKLKAVAIGVSLGVEWRPSKPRQASNHVGQPERNARTHAALTCTPCL